MKITYQDFDGQVGELDTGLGWEQTLEHLLVFRGDIEKAWFDDYAMSGKPQYTREHEIMMHPGMICQCEPMGDDMAFGLVVIDKDGTPNRKNDKGEYEQIGRCPYCRMWVQRFDWRAKHRMPESEPEQEQEHESDTQN